MTEVPAVGSRVIAPNKRSVIVRLDPETGRRYIRYTSKKSNPPGKVVIKYLEKTTKSGPKEIVMCSKKVSLPAMQKIAQAAGIDIHDSRPLKNIRGELYKRHVGCSTLFKRMKAVNPTLLSQLGIKLKETRSGEPEVVQVTPETEPEAKPEAEAKSEADSEDDAFDIPLSEQKALVPNTGSTAIVPYRIGDQTMDFGLKHKTKHKIMVDGKSKILYRGARGGYFYRKKGQNVYVKAKDLLKKINKKSDKKDKKKDAKKAKKMKKTITVAGRKRTLYKGKKGGMYYKSKGRKVYVK